MSILPQNKDASDYMQQERRHIEKLEDWCKNSPYPENKILAIAKNF